MPREIQKDTTVPLSMMILYSCMQKSVFIMLHNYAGYISRNLKLKFRIRFSLLDSRPSTFSTTYLRTLNVLI